MLHVRPSSGGRYQNTLCHNQQKPQPKSSPSLQPKSHQICKPQYDASKGEALNGTPRYERIWRSGGRAPRIP
jgi:hypothetical protein